MRPELGALPVQLKAAHSDEEREELVLHALSTARDNVALVLSDPLAAQKAAQFQQAYEIRVMQSLRMMQERQFAVQQLMARQAREAQMVRAEQMNRRPMIRLQ